MCLQHTLLITSSDPLVKFIWLGPYQINSCEMIRLYFSFIKCVWHCCKFVVNDHICVNFVPVDVIALVLCLQFHHFVLGFLFSVSPDLFLWWTRPFPRWSMALSTAVEWEIWSTIYHGSSSVLCKGSHGVSTQSLPRDEWFMTDIVLHKWFSSRSNDVHIICCRPQSQSWWENWILIPKGVSVCWKSSYQYRKSHH